MKDTLFLSAASVTMRISLVTFNMNCMNTDKELLVKVKF